jgi:hypothetical protein
MLSLKNYNPLVYKVKKGTLFIIPNPKVKGRGKLPPPPAIHPNKVKTQRKNACRSPLKTTDFTDNFEL